jgi:hypothetical protein
MFTGVNNTESNLLSHQYYLLAPSCKQINYLKFPPPPHVKKEKGGLLNILSSTSVRDRFESIVDK